MATRAIAEKWLGELTFLPTASGLEHRVVEWVTRWVRRRSDLKLAIDSGGNLLITQKGRKTRPAVLAVAHMDHPAFVTTHVDGTRVSFEFRGGVNPEYFADARVEFAEPSPGIGGRVVSYDPETQTGEILASGSGVIPGSIGMWKFPRTRSVRDRFRAPACDDLAGCAAALAALDRARGNPKLRHFGVLLTRAEEVGLVGAIHAAKTRSIPADARILSIETSRASANAPIGAGPVIRIGDAVTVFDANLSNRIAGAVAAAGIRHQRKLMDGGGCEATAFGVYGYQSTGLCLALGNWHNRGNLDEFEAGTGNPIPMLEEISIADFHGLIDLLLVAATGVDVEPTLEDRFDRHYEDVAGILT